MTFLNTEKRKPLIYMIDSDETLLISLSTLFDSLSAEIQCFNDAESFLKMKIDRLASCLLVEAKLPGIDGIELIEWLRNNNIYIPTMVMSSYSDVNTAVRAMQASALDFLEKPLVEAILLREVKKLLHAD